MQKLREPHGVARLFERTNEATGEVELILRITLERLKGKSLVTEYSVTDLCPDPAVAFPAYRLTKTDLSESYDIAKFPSGLECTCRDYIHRRQNLRSGCKHCKSALAVRLFERKGRNQSSEASNADVS